MVGCSAVRERNEGKSECQLVSVHTSRSSPARTRCCTRSSGPIEPLPLDRPRRAAARNNCFADIGCDEDRRVH